MNAILKEAHLQRVARKAKTLNTSQVYIAGRVVSLSQQPSQSIAHQCWPSCYTLCKYFEANRGLLTNKRIIELGAGVGLLGITACILDASKVVVTDVEQALGLLSINITQNGVDDKCTVSLLRWGNTEDIKAIRDEHGLFDVIFCSELLYQPQFIDSLMETLDALIALQPSAIIYVAHRERLDDKETVDRLLEHFNHKKLSLDCVAPKYVGSKMVLYKMSQAKSQFLTNGDGNK